MENIGSVWAVALDEPAYKKYDNVFFTNNHVVKDCIGNEKYLTVARLYADEVPGQHFEIHICEGFQCELFPRLHLLSDQLEVWLTQAELEILLRGRRRLLFRSLNLPAVLVAALNPVQSC